MNALVVIEQDPSQMPFVEAMAVRLADEGIPVRAIARSVKIPSDEVYQMLKDAIARGAIVEMPKDDWPPGSSRSYRTAFNGTPLENEEELKIACAHKFKVTRLEAAVLATMLRRNTLTKQQLHIVIEQNRPTPGREETTEKMIDVVICHLRKKLKLHSLFIETIWGIGYMIPPADRDRAVAQLCREAPLLLEAS